MAQEDMNLALEGGLRCIRYEGTRQPYLYICTPIQPEERVNALLRLLYDYGYRFFAPLPGDEDINGDSGFFFKDDRMEQAHRMIVILPEEGADKLRPYEEQGLREWLEHHSPLDVMVVHLGRGEAFAPLTKLLADSPHLRPGSAETWDDFAQRLLEMLLPREYDPARDMSLHPEQRTEEPDTRWLHIRRILLTCGFTLLLAPIAAGFIAVPAVEPLVRHLTFAEDLLLLGYGILLVIMMYSWERLARHGLSRQCRIGMHRTMGMLRMGNFLVMTALIAFCGLLTADTQSMEAALGAILWRCILNLGTWTLLEAALCLVVGDGLMIERDRLSRDIGILSGTLLALVMAMHGLAGWMGLCTEPSMTLLLLIPACTALLFFFLMNKVCASVCQLSER